MKVGPTEDETRSRLLVRPAEYGSESVVAADPGVPLVDTAAYRVNGLESREEAPISPVTTCGSWNLV